MTHRSEAAPAPRLIIAPTAFKATLSASQAAGAMAAGARAGCPRAEVVEMPVSDGGPGLIDALRAARGGDIREVEAHDPLSRPLRARVLLMVRERRRVAVLESADACGMHLLSGSERDPLRAHTRGVGELIAAAFALAGTVVVGLGGSATVDGGAGMADALGWRLLDDAGRPLEPGGAALPGLERILQPEASAQRPRRVIALADVHNPLIGPLGAAATFGPQKGAAPADVPRLEAGLRRLGDVIRRDLAVDVSGLRGAGAAGGLGAACVAFLGASLEDGASWVLNATGFDRHLAGAGLVVTGEGSWDAQSSMGKITGEVVARAGRAGVPVLLVAGRVTGAVPPHVVVAQTGEVDGAMLDADDLRRTVARELARRGALFGC